MAVKRNGLGKGLDSLIPNKSEKTVKKPVKSDEIAPKTDEKETKNGEMMIKINQVAPNRDQP